MTGRCGKRCFRIICRRSSREVAVAVDSKSLDKNQGPRDGNQEISWQFAAAVGSKSLDKNETQ